MNIVLIGFRCAGKTSVGQTLASRLHRPFIDCDEYIEKKTGLSIREIFEIAGEQYFRLLEGDALSEMAKLDGRVIATGGGAALRYKTMKNLKRNGIIIHLEANLDSVLARLQADVKSRTRRPSLTEKDPREEIREQLDLRRPYYQSAAEFVVHTDEKPVDVIVGEITEYLKTKGLSSTPEGDQGRGGDDGDEAVA